MTNETKSLSEQLGDWRCERPDEWKMDEFIRMAEQLQARNAELEQDNTTQHDLIIRQSEILTNAVNAAKGKPEIGLHSHHDLAEIVAELVQQNRGLMAHVEQLQARNAELDRIKRDPRICELTDRLVGIGPPLSASEKHEVADFLYEIPE